MRRLLPTLISVVLLTGCSTDATREARLSFDTLPELLAQIGAAKDVRVFEGLPDPSMEPDLFEKELARTKTIEIDGHPFYAEPVPALPEKLTALWEAIASPALYVAYADPDSEKACGGFHPDWCVVADKGGESLHFHFCFGCHDLAVFVNGQLQVWCEFDDVAALKQSFQPMRTNRPQESRHGAE